jgi:hypothetical protein
VHPPKRPNSLKTVWAEVTIAILASSGPDTDKIIYRFIAMVNSGYDIDDHVQPGDVEGTNNCKTISIKLWLTKRTILAGNVHANVDQLGIHDTTTP